MKKSKLYLILIIIDAILIIGWPICLIGIVPPTFLVFLCGAVWGSDIIDLFFHIRMYKHWKKIEEALND